MPKLLAIVGPTASGKTRLSLALAEQMGGEILSADSRQIYKHMDIGTAKPTREERKNIPHYFIDILDPREEYNAGAFGTDARQRIADIIRRKKIPILVGGSGLYIKSVIDGFFEGPGKDPEIRAQIEARMNKEGIENLLSALQKVDPLTASHMEVSKPRRIMRALEVYYSTGKPISQLHAEQASVPSFEVVQFGLQWERERLYNRINERVDSMFSHGLIEEVEDLRSKGYTRELNALNTVGYKEVFEYLEGKFDRNRLINLVKQNTRRFAKRQLTWFRTDSRINWIDVDETSSTDDIALLAKRALVQYGRS